MTTAKPSASEQARAWLALSPLVLDTETTGLGDNAEIIELAIVDTDGNAVFSSRLNPITVIEPGAQAIHGISAVDLEFAPRWPDIIDQVKSAIAGRPVLIFNAEFDDRLIRQTCAAHGISTDWWGQSDKLCAMQLAATAFGATNRYGGISLANATKAAGVTWAGEAHSATADAIATARLVCAIAADGQQKGALC